MAALPPRAAQAHTDTPVQPPAPRIADGVQTSVPAVDAALNAPPAPEDAAVVNPYTGQTTYYGTELGRQQLASLLPAGSAAVAGPEVPVGFWQSINLQAGLSAIMAVAGAPDGRLFAGVNGGGLRVYAPDGNGVYGWTAINAGAGSLPSQNVTALAVFNNALWVGTSNAGIGQMNLTTGTWTTINSSNSSLPGNAIATLKPVTPPDGSTPYIWISTSAGAARWTPGNPGVWKVLKTTDGLPSNNVLDVAVQYLGTTPWTWIATDSSAGLARWVNNSISLVDQPTGCTLDRGTRLEVDSTGFLWVNAQQDIPARAAGSATSDAPSAGDIFTSIGICRFFPFIGWSQYTSGTNGLPSNSATGFAADQGGRMWISFNGGLAVHDSGGWASYTAPTYPLANNNIFSIAAVGESIWLGHNGLTSLTQYAPNWDSFSAAEMKSTGTPGALLLEDSTAWVGMPTGVVSYTNNAWNNLEVPGIGAPVSTLARDGNGSLWMGTAGHGAWRWDGGNKFVHFPSGGLTGLPGSHVRDIQIDQNGRVWVATEAGLALRGTNYWLIFQTSNSGLPANDLTSLALDQSNRLWIATNGQGIAIYTPDVANGWATVTAAANLPSPVVNALAADSSGGMWAGTDAGLAYWNPITSAWTTYTTANGLPHNQVLSLGMDTVGDVWVGTASGLVRQSVGKWGRFLRVIDSSLGSNRIRAVAGDGTSTWAVAGSTVAVRGPFGQPLGKPTPSISSFTPGQGVPTETQITITGQNFDSRGADYNQVYFGHPSALYQATILTVTSTSLVVQPPVGARTGRIYVRANNQVATSATDFQVAPKISSFSPQLCAPIGSVLTLTGKGLAGLGSYQTYVKVGDGNWRLADSFYDTKLQVVVRSGDTDGKVMVRLGQNGPSTTSTSDVKVGTLQLTATNIQQAIQGEQLIWGKRTLVQLGVALPTGCFTTVSGRMDWKKKDGSLHAASVYMSPMTTPIGPGTTGVDLNIRPNFVGEWETARSSYTDLFPLSEFNGAKITLRSNGIVALNVDIPASAFQFIDPGIQHRFVFQAVVPTGGPSAAFWQDAILGMRHFARNFPQQDVDFRYGPQYWMTWVQTPLVWDDVDLNPSEWFGNDDSGDIRSQVSDYLDPSGNWSGIALIDFEAYDKDSEADGLWGSIYDTGIVVNRPGVSGKTMMHETMHHLGMVSVTADNWDGPGSFEDLFDPNAWTHSKYDEGRWFDDTKPNNGLGDCVKSRTYDKALINQTGKLRQLIVLQEGVEPFEVPALSCVPGTYAKSVIAYAPNRFNDNSFVEPADWRYMVDDFTARFTTSVRALQAPKAEQSLLLHARINQSGLVTPTVSYVEETPGVLSTPDPTGSYRLVVRDSGDQMLGEHPFAISFNPGHVHNGNDTQTVVLTDQPESYLLLRVAWPTGAAKVELVKNSVTIWSQTVSNNAPTVSFITPIGGSYNPDTGIDITWAADDLDGENLLFGLDYSPDNGTTWEVVAPSLTGTNYHWTPGYSLASTTARLRLRVSDGLRTGNALSAPFTLTPRAPTAFILDPVAGQKFNEGDLLNLEGGSVTSQGMDAGDFAWSYDGQSIDSGKSISYTLEETGVHTFTLQVTVGGQASSTSVAVEVVADSDNDGLPNDWEQSKHFNPLYAGDADEDADGDGLTNGTEYHRKTDPWMKDTDGDGVNDGAEVEAGTDPLLANDKPVVTPNLVTGADSLFFVSALDGAEQSTSFWTTNGAVGVINFSAGSDSAWLKVTPENGSTPAQMTITVTPAGLAPGNYTGKVTVQSAGADGSPDQISVLLTVQNANAIQLFLPTIIR